MSTGTIQAFQPIATVTVAASTTSAATAALPPNADSILVFNASGATAFVAMGASVATPSTGTPIPAGGRQLFDSSPYITSAAVILASGSGSVYFTAGLGTAY